MHAILNLNIMKRTALILIAVMGLLSFLPRVEAGFIQTEQTMASASDRDQDLSKVQKVLENKMVKERLASLGYSNEEINTKLSKLSDGEMHSLASQIDALAPGGEIGLLIGILLIILLVVVIMRLV